MEVHFKKPLVFGNRPFKVGVHLVPDHFFSNRAFKKAVVAGHVMIIPRDADALKIQSARDMKALQHAKTRRLAVKVQKSAQAIAGAVSAQPVAGSIQALPTPALPIPQAAGTVQAVPAASAQQGG